MNNTKWYRLKVVGFKNEKEATAYAAKIKKKIELKHYEGADSETAGWVRVGGGLGGWGGGGGGVVGGG